MIAKLKTLLDLFRKGNRLTDAALWQNRAALVGVLTAFLIAVVSALRAFGFDLNLDDDTLERAAYGIAALVPIFMAVVQAITSRGVGLPEKKDAP